MSTKLALNRAAPFRSSTSGRRTEEDSLSTRNIVDRLLLLAIIGSAALLRVLQLNRFLAYDEALWASRSSKFLIALQSQDWAASFQMGHPGVTTMWSGVVGLFLYGIRHELSSTAFEDLLQLVANGDSGLDIWPYIRFPGIVISVFVIVGIYILVIRLFDRRVAATASFMLALDPWYLAHSPRLASRCPNGRLHADLGSSPASIPLANPCTAILIALLHLRWIGFAFQDAGAIPDSVDPLGVWRGASTTPYQPDSSSH